MYFQGIRASLSIDTSSINAIAKHYQLGRVLSAPSPLYGGRLHQQWKVCTDAGNFAIKCLNTTIMRKPNAAAIYRQSEQIAMAYSETIHTVHAIHIKNDALFYINNHAYLVYPYIDGSHLLPNDVEKSHVQIISKTLAMMHTGKKYICESPGIEQVIFTADMISNFIQKLEHIEPIISKALNENTTLIIHIMSAYHKMKNFLSADIVISHRDLDINNVLWIKDFYYIIDWEYAGRINRSFDLVSTAVYWSIDKDYTINQTHFDLFITQYQQHSACTITREQLQKGYIAMLASWIHWLMFNMERLINNPKSSHEYQTGLTEVRLSLNVLPYTYHQQTRCLGLRKI